MKLTKKQNELINSGITLTDTEAKQVEDLIQRRSKPVKAKHLNHYCCLSASRGAGSNATYAERYRLENTGV